MSITLRKNKASELTFDEVDNNFKSLYYSSSINDGFINFFFTGSNESHSIDLSSIPGADGIGVFNGSDFIKNAKFINFEGPQVEVTSVAGGGVKAAFQGLFDEISPDQYQSTSSFAITGSFTGSFIGDGSGITNISASNVVGLNLSQISTGSVSASVNLEDDIFLIQSSSVDVFKIDSQGVATFPTQSTPPTPKVGAIYFSEENFFVGLDS
jgi:hypothetical protein